MVGDTVQSNVVPSGEHQRARPLAAPDPGSAIIGWTTRARMCPTSDKAPKVPRLIGHVDERGVRGRVDRNAAGRADRRAWGHAE